MWIMFVEIFLYFKFHVFYENDKKSNKPGACFIYIFDEKNTAAIAVQNSTNDVQTNYALCRIA